MNFNSISQRSLNDAKQISRWIKYTCTKFIKKNNSLTQKYIRNQDQVY